MAGACSEGQVVLDLRVKLRVRDDDNPTGRYGFRASLHNELSTQNWSGQGESDSLIKTKHCDGLKRC